MDRNAQLRARLALAAKSYAANKPKRVQAAQNTDGEDRIAGSVSGGHRAGKRRRGNSLTKTAPRTSTLVTTYNVRDADGDIVATVKTLTYKRQS